MVAENADRVGVMYAGELLEEGTRAAFFAAPQHPYSRMLFEALPRPGDGARLDHDSRPSAEARRSDAWLPLRAALSVAIARCRDESPDWQAINDQLVRCHLAGVLPLRSARAVATPMHSTQVAQALLQVDG